ncbi:MAG: hypothetical protein D6727_01680 [Gammaproteobacteria bacterium]|nr:MAG: hypothetical protein D6727_01680 [Gammaproteobacteria bacterium]
MRVPTTTGWQVSAETGATPDESLLAGLTVCHWPLPRHAPAAPPAGVIRMRSCQRELWIALGSRDAALLRGADRRCGAAAYALLLEVITGLHSEIPGETNVLGQFRRAWEQGRERLNRQQLVALAPIVHRLLNDAAAIRREHLEGIGGNSYGSLLRKLLRPRRGERVLLVGCGNLALTLLPFLKRQTVGLWHHRPLAEAPAAATRCVAPADGAAAARWAQQLVLTTPADPGNDARWAAWLRAAGPKPVVHLGRRRDDIGQFVAALGFPAASLDDLFDLREQLSRQRRRQLAQARMACRRCALAAAGCHEPDAGAIAQLARA